MDNDNDDKVFIKNRLDLLDQSSEKYKDLIAITDVDFEYEHESVKLVFKKNNHVEYSAEVTLLGVFDVNSRIWIWGWCLPDVNTYQIKDSMKVLNYGLSLEPSTNSKIHFYIKAHLVNSRLYFENKSDLDIHLGMALYISKKGKFIYSKTLRIINGKQLVVYYIVY